MTGQNVPSLLAAEGAIQTMVSSLVKHLVENPGDVESLLRMYSVAALIRFVRENCLETTEERKALLRSRQLGKDSVIRTFIELFQFGILPFVRHNEEKEVLKEIEISGSFDWMTFRLCGVVVPVDVVRIILGFFGYDRSLILSVGMVNWDFYSLVLSSWDVPVKVQKGLCLTIPVVVLRRAKVFVLDLPLRNYRQKTQPGFTDRELVYFFREACSTMQGLQITNSVSEENVGKIIAFAFVGKDFSFPSLRSIHFGRQHGWRTDHHRPQFPENVRLSELAPNLTEVCFPKYLAWCENLRLRSFSGLVGDLRKAPLWSNLSRLELFVPGSSAKEPPLDSAVDLFVSILQNLRVCVFREVALAFWSRVCEIVGQDPLVNLETLTLKARRAYAPWPDRRYLPSPCSRLNLPNLRELRMGSFPLEEQVSLAISCKKLRRLSLDVPGDDFTFSGELVLPGECSAKETRRLLDLVMPHLSRFSSLKVCSGHGLLEILHGGTFAILAIFPTSGISWYTSMSNEYVRYVLQSFCPNLARFKVVSPEREWEIAKAKFSSISQFQKAVKTERKVPKRFQTRAGPLTGIVAEYRFSSGDDHASSRSNSEAGD